MSRAIHIDAPQADVAATCTKRNVPISAIEALLSGGTRIVLNTTADAEIIRLAYKSKLITVPVTREKWIHK